MGFNATGSVAVIEAAPSLRRATQEASGSVDLAQVEDRLD
jgi:hypothetical protein